MDGQGSREPNGWSPGDTPTRHHQGLDLPVGATFLPGNRGPGTPSLLSQLISRLAWGFPSIPASATSVTGHESHHNAVVGHDHPTAAATGPSLSSIFSTWIQRQQQQQQQQQQRQQQQQQLPQSGSGEGGMQAGVAADHHTLHAPRPLPPIQLRPRPNAPSPTPLTAATTATPTPAATATSTAVARSPTLMHLPSISTISDGEDTPVVWTNTQAGAQGAWSVHMALHESGDAEHDQLLSAWQQPPPCLPGGDSPRETATTSAHHTDPDATDSPRDSHMHTPRTPAEQLRQPLLLPPHAPRHSHPIHPHTHPSPHPSVTPLRPQHSLPPRPHPPPPPQPHSDPHPHLLQPRTTLDAHVSDDASSMTSYSSESPFSPGAVHPWAVHPLVDTPSELSTDRPPDVNWPSTSTTHTTPNSGWTSNAAATVTGPWHPHPRIIETADQASQTIHRLATPSFPPSGSDSGPESPGYIYSDVSHTTLDISQCLQEEEEDGMSSSTQHDEESATAVPDDVDHDDDDHLLPLPPALTTVSVGSHRHVISLVNHQVTGPSLPPATLSDALFEAALVTSSTAQNHTYTGLDTGADAASAPVAGHGPGSGSHSRGTSSNGTSGLSVVTGSESGSRSVFYWGYGTLLRPPVGRLPSSSGSSPRPLGYCAPPANAQLRPLQAATAAAAGEASGTAVAAPPQARGSDSGGGSAVGAGTRLPLAPRPIRQTVSSSGTASTGTRFSSLSGSGTTTITTSTTSTATTTTHPAGTFPHSTGRVRSTSASGPNPGGAHGTSTMGVRSVGVATPAAAGSALAPVRRWSANGGGPTAARPYVSSSGGGSTTMTREAHQARIRVLLSTRHWTGNEPPGGNPLAGMEIPAWAKRFAPPIPNGSPEPSTVTGTLSTRPAQHIITTTSSSSSSSSSSSRHALLSLDAPEQPHGSTVQITTSSYAQSQSQSQDRTIINTTQRANAHPNHQDTSTNPTVSTVSALSDQMPRASSADVTCCVHMPSSATTTATTTTTTNTDAAASSPGCSTSTENCQETNNCGSTNITINGPVSSAVLPITPPQDVRSDGDRTDDVVRYHRQSTGGTSTYNSQSSNAVTILYSSCHTSSVGSTSTDNSSADNSRDLSTIRMDMTNSAAVSSLSAPDARAMRDMSTVSAVTAILSGSPAPPARRPLLPLSHGTAATTVAEAIASAVVEAAIVAAAAAAASDGPHHTRSLPWPATPGAGRPVRADDSDSDRDNAVRSAVHANEEDWDTCSLLPLPSLTLSGGVDVQPVMATAITQTDASMSASDSDRSALMSALQSARETTSMSSMSIGHTNDLAWADDGTGTGADTPGMSTNQLTGIDAFDTPPDQRVRPLAEPPATTNLRLALERLSSRFNMPSAVPRGTGAGSVRPVVHHDTLSYPIEDLPITSLAASRNRLNTHPHPHPQPFAMASPAGRRLSFMDYGRRYSQRGGQPDEPSASTVTSARPATRTTTIAAGIASMGPASSPGRLTPSSTTDTGHATPSTYSPERSRFAHSRARRASAESPDLPAVSWSTAGVRGRASAQGVDGVRGGPGARDGRGELGQLEEHVSFAFGASEALDGSGQSAAGEVWNGSRRDSRRVLDAADLELPALLDRNDGSGAGSGDATRGGGAGGVGSSNGAFLDTGMQTRQERRNAVCYTHGVPVGLAAQLGAMLDPEASTPVLASAESTPTVGAGARDRQARDALLFTPAVHQMLLEMGPWLDSQGVDATAPCIIRMATWLAGEYSWLQDVEH